MIRPYEWTEFFLTDPGLGDLQARIYDPLGEVILSVVPTEIADGTYRAGLQLERTYIGSSVYLRWYSAVGEVSDVRHISIVGRKMSLDVLNRVAAPDTSPNLLELLSLDESQLPRDVGYLPNASDTISIAQYAPVRLAEDDRAGMQVADNTQGSFIGFVQQAVLGGGGTVPVTIGGVAVCKAIVAEEWNIGQPLYLSPTDELTKTPDVDTDDLWVCQVGQAWVAKASGVAVGAVHIEPMAPSQN